MRIGLLSDTHIPVAAEALPIEVLAAFIGVDLILHAGDIYSFSVLDDLEGIAPVLAARGYDDVRPQIKRDQRVKSKHVLNLSGQTLWLVHEWSYWEMKGLKAMREAGERCQENIPDVVVYGHLHRPSIEHFNGILFINSGSPTLLEYQKGLGTVGILTIDSGKVDAEIIRFQ